jgi:hypothetical protein
MGTVKLRTSIVTALFRPIGLFAVVGGGQQDGFLPLIDLIEESPLADDAFMRESYGRRTSVLQGIYSTDPQPRGIDGP